MVSPRWLQVQLRWLLAVFLPSYLLESWFWCSYGFSLRVRQFLRRLGLVLTLPSVRAITHVGTDSFTLPALANRNFLAAGLIRAIRFSNPCYFCFLLPRL